MSEENDKEKTTPVETDADTEVTDNATSGNEAEQDSGSAKLSGKKFFPHHVLILSVLMAFVLVFVGYMAQTYPIPDDAPMEIPFPDDGEDIPGPEWLFLLFWIPFWYFKGRLKKYLFLTSVVPIVIVIFLIFLPYFHKLPLDRIPGLKGILSKVRERKTGLVKSFAYALFPLIFFAVVSVTMYKSGHQAKTLGCDSCHNPAMGHRMAIPPVDVFGYYSIDRARQIGIGKYRAGKSSGVTESGDQVYAGSDEGGYKDADWQMRHMYEPTFTW